MEKRKITALMAAAVIAASLCGCAVSGESAEKGENVITLSGNTAAIDGEKIAEFDYTRSYDPSMTEPEYTGDSPYGDIYIAHDIVYYPEIEESAFSKENYDGETEWVTRFTASGLEDYIFSTLPLLGNELPTQMMHTAKEAYDNPVLHITKAGSYTLTGDWQGQILVDLNGDEDCFDDESQKVTLILNGADIKCTVAPAVIFYDAFECDNTWEERNENTGSADLTNAGARVIIADGSENNVEGANVFRLLKPEYKKDSTTVQKKLVKTDGAFYSYVSLAIDGQTRGTGILNITSSTYEGLDSELHLTVNGGYINIVSQDDGINVNEDGVSVFTLNGGHLTIFAGQGAEGDVIDSNGFIDINGGFVAGASPSVSDNMLDSDCGTDVSDSATVISCASTAMQGGPGNMPGNKPDGDMQAPPDKPDGDMQTPPEKPEGDMQTPPGGFEHPDNFNQTQKPAI